MFLRFPATTISLLWIFPDTPMAIRDRRPRADEAGQATAEYALVLLAVAALAILLVVWASKTNLVGDLFDAVFDRLTKRAKSAGS